MPDPIYFCLEESGEIKDTSYIDLGTSNEPYEYGQFIASELEYLDQRADALSVRPISSFFLPSEGDKDVWHGYVEGLETFEPLLTDLLAQLRIDEPIPNATRLIWDMRICELILRKAEIRCEGFYLRY